MKKKAYNKPRKISTEPVTQPSIPVSDSVFDKKKYIMIFSLFCAILGFGLYIQTIGHDYVLDDEMVTFKNSIVTEGVSAIPKILTTAYREGFWDRKESLYRPLSLVMFAVEWQIAPNQPWLHHLINILLYAFTGWLVYRFFNRLMPSLHPLIPLTAALLFIVHPLHTEVVANIKSRDEMLALVFGILSLEQFLNYVQESKFKHILLGALCFLLAVLAKESAITLFAIVPLTLFFFSKPKKKDYLISLAVLSLAVLAYFGMRISALGELSNFNEIAVINNSIVAAKNGSEHFATAFVLVGAYLRLFLFPHPLSYDYSYNTFPIVTVSDPQFLLSFGAFIAIVVYIFFHWKKKDVAVYGLVFFGLTISIVSNMVIIIEATLGERFAYLPSLGLCMALPVLGERLFKLKKNSVGLPFLQMLKANTSFTLIFGIIIVVFALKTLSRNPDWKTSATLFTADKDHNPHSARVQFSYASNMLYKKIISMDDNNPQKTALAREAIEYLNRSIKIMPDYFDAWVHLVIAYRIVKDFPAAAQAYEHGIQFKNKDNIDFYIQGALTYSDLGMWEKAISANQLALALDSSRAEIWNNYGMCLTEMGNRSDAFMALLRSLQLDSTQSNTWYNVGNWHAKGGDYLSAIGLYRKALERDSVHVGSLNNTGNCYAAMGQYETAITFYEKTLAIQPNNVEATRNIGITYNRMGQPDKANAYLSRLSNDTR
ncbi:MAG: tetratricopeptide repeat protein [Flavobacteriales bacterium]|nr:tetratricopeptide repeat protein [Flavobacteriales bacterium]